MKLKVIKKRSSGSKYEFKWESVLNESYSNTPDNVDVNNSNNNNDNREKASLSDQLYQSCPCICVKGPAKKFKEEVIDLFASVVDYPLDFSWNGVSLHRISLNSALF